MKTLTFLLFSFCALSSLGQKIDGVWQDSTGTSFHNCIAIFATKNDSVFMTHYLEFKGQPFVEFGTGIIINDSLNYTVRVSKGIEGWSTAGIHRLKLSADRKTLRGTYSDNTGNTGPIVLKRISK